MAAGSGAGPADGVGITAMYFYVPRAYVRHAELETFDGVPTGKYVVGLGQQGMAVCGDNEDAVSLSMSALQGLLDRGGVRAADVGRLEVGTETVTDKAKSVKTYLMPLLAAPGDAAAADVEGVDCLNACYGATAALLNTVAWVESRSWDGRLGVVVGADIAIYGNAVARPTGGAGAVALAVGPNASLQFEPGLRASHVAHEYDFFKPDLASEYPTVDGRLSNRCFLRALDACYALYVAKFERRLGRAFDLDADIDYVVFHSPYCKLVQRAFARLVYLETRRRPDHRLRADARLAQYADLPLEATYDDADLDKAFRAAGHDAFEKRVAPSLRLPRETGNSYCACVYGALLSVLASAPPAELVGKRILVFSYGSGMASTLYSLRVTGDVTPLVAPSQLDAQLADRVAISPATFVETLRAREAAYGAQRAAPASPAEWVRPGAYRLSHIDNYRRAYTRVPM